MANEILGATRYATIVDEVTWGTFPGSPTYYHIPVDEYSVLMDPENHQSDPHLGLFQEKHNSNWRGMPKGNLVCSLYGWRPSGLATSIQQYLLDWCFNSEWEVAALASKSIEWAEGPDVANKRHTGLRVNGATLSGDANSAEPKLSIDLMGMSEANVVTAQTLPANRNLAVAGQYPLYTFALAGVAIKLSAFSLQIQNQLKVEFLNDTRPTLLLKTRRVVTLSFTPVKNSDTYDAYNRAVTMTEFTGSLVVKALNNGTGTGGTTLDIGTFTFPRLSFIKAQTAGSKQDILKQPLQMKALKPDTSGKDVTIAWTET